MTRPTAPIVNINGTSHEALFGGYVDAINAIQEAVKALQSITPHGRDFQISPPGAYETARAEHIDRIRHLAKIENDLVFIALSLERN